MNFDITMTATIRPAIFKKCLKSVVSHIISCNPNYNFRLIINIDPAGETDKFNQKTIEDIAKKYHKNSVFIKPNKPNFPIAVKNIWNLVESDFSLHTEDDRLFVQNVNIDDILNIFDENVGIMWIQGKLKRLSAFGFSINEKNNHWLINKDKKSPNCLLTLHPCVYRKEMLKGLIKYIKDGVSPEKVLRLQDVSKLSEIEKDDLIRWINNWSFMVYSNHEQSIYSRDIGKLWRKKMGFIKNKKGKLKSVRTTWIKKKS